MQPTHISLNDLRTVHHTDQHLEHYADDDNLPVVFRLQKPGQPDRFTASSITARQWIADGFSVVGIEFANEMLRPGVFEFRAFVREDASDRIYTLVPDEQITLGQPDSGWMDQGIIFGTFATTQLQL
jgi:hypothetical protein